jgi:hypothetical protein
LLGSLVSDLTYTTCTKHLRNLDVLVWLFAFSCYTIHRLPHSLTNQSCGPLLNWNDTLFSKMAPWRGQVRGHSLFDKKFSQPLRGFAPGFVNYKKGTLDSQPQVIEFISCLPMVDGSLLVLRLLPPLKLVAMIY